MDKNCPNCGAVSSGYVCQYCGTRLYTREEALKGMFGKRCHMFYETDGALVCLDIMVESIERNYDTIELYSFDRVPYVTLNGNLRITIEGSVLDPELESFDKLYPTSQFSPSV